ncbi:hypothetical protein TOPH_08110 [Tolypocladium ophioglossoides CBS 100239]|uniref:Aminoglycoside phosphotransferase domain-containing protein n=1 Tax=Tolypocladium ophioglossoides (strain CBS 100239) TaxID=1163406 RepID=A0A0L0MZL1_TOLOC|nr:hypothetical protein TOPH_08110 [Tolypocladium ophioglossoides CBS 100239]
MADIARRIPSASSVQQLARIQVNNFFTRHPGLSQEQCIKLAAGILGCRRDEVLPAETQGAYSFTLVRANSPARETVVQFRDLGSPLNIEILQLARETYCSMAHSCRVIDCGLDDEALVYAMSRIDGSAFAVAKRDLYYDQNGERLIRLVGDFAIFIASSLASLRLLEPSQSDAQLYNAIKKLDTLRSNVPAHLQPKLAEVYDRVPVIFGRQHAQVLNHADLQEPNIHVDITSGAMVGVVDWDDAEIGPFGTALSWFEPLLFAITADGERYWHPLHRCLRQVFYDALCDALEAQCGNLAKDQFYLDPNAIEAARAFCLFINYAKNDRDGGGPSQLSLATLEACLAEETAIQPFLQRLSRSGHY